MLWTCLHFPRLPLQIFLRASSAPGPLAVTSAGTRSEILVCNGEAQALGLAPGMAVGAALALAPDLILRLRDEKAELEALRNIALWAEQITSGIALVPPFSVLLETGGSLRYFGGLTALLARIRQGLEELGHEAHIASAPTPSAARLLARAGKEMSIIRPEALEEALSALPLDCLEHEPAALTTLQAMGVGTLGDCLELPRDGLARRFGQALLDRLDRALGTMPDPVIPFVPPQQYTGRLELAAPVWEAEPLLFACKRLVLELAGWLKGRGLGVTRLELLFRHEDCAPTSLLLRLSAPSREAGHLLLLLRERLGATRLPDRVEAITLTSIETAARCSTNLSLLPDGAKSEGEDASLPDRLRARLGEDAVYTLMPCPDHRPERAWLVGEGSGPVAHPSDTPRPLWLLPEPRSLGSAPHSGGGPLVLMDGPERIESGWWDGRDVRRDYFVARMAAGETLWIYRNRDGQGGWFLHGIFA
jgi:protein ImuB